MSIKSIKVSELGLILEEYIDSIDLNYFWIEGEIQNYRGSNKHYYFSLNEKNYSIKSIIWESIYQKLNITITNGLKGKFYGKLNYYKNKNELSFVIYKVKIDSDIGDIYAKLEQYKRICNEKGYFDKIPKQIKNLNNIGIITRYESAAYNDITSSIIECIDMRVYVYDSGMQGMQSIDEIIYGIGVLNKLSKKLNLDCIIVTRGGGSKEDLWIFNELRLVEAIYNSKLPVITAIGHEIDTSLIDLVSDKNCITPTDAGRYIYSFKSLDLYLENLDNYKDQIDLKLKTYYNRKIDKLNTINRGMDLDRITNTLDEKIANLQKYKHLFQKKLKNYAINKLSTLNYIRNDTENIINNILNIKIMDGQKLITSPDNLLKGGEYKLKFNKKIFKIKII